MSYLAMSAAPIESENTQNYNADNIISKKKHAQTSHSKTQKQRIPSSDFNPQKVNSILQSIHNTPHEENELGSYNPSGNSESAKHSDDFKPLNPYEFPEKPMSMGGERTKKMEGMTNIDDSLVPKPADDDDLNLQELQSNFMNDAQVKEYYRKLVPNYNHPKISEMNKNYHSSAYLPNMNMNTNMNTNDNSQVLIEKLNYMINLLEEQQDQKTGSITEEVVLYSFLGVFMIFIVDSFARVGKYVR
jgi:hypothetical protein